MVKLATARECRAYGLGGGGRAARGRWEYINAGAYVFAAVLLAGGFGWHLSAWSATTRSGLAAAALGLLLLLAVNAHDLLAHAAGVDYSLALAAGLDSQFALVEVAVPAVHFAGTVLTLIALIFFEIQMARGYRHSLEKHGLNMLIAGPALWLLGSIQNICQVYERANGHVQILQKCVQTPLLLGSTLFLIGGIINRHDIHSRSTSRSELLGRSWGWFCVSGSLLFVAAGLMNLLKVFKMQQMDGRGLEKLRGGAQERLNREREGKVPLILEEGRRRTPAPVSGQVPPPPAGSYKEAVVSGAPAG
ncbi:hypothetical protein OsI_06627 [Oryza sativa Indica Group]|uniref:Uncharacterized protein n=1 Tax=Oryza sativa subsp. indica TaxID=39946 RepID=A2X344_ORYSI|nr:hypothetical protein OsI_06627 [Oryza sativa Indica Group]